MSDQKQTHQPSLILKSVDSEHLGLRLMDIGRHQRFDSVLKRLRLDFPLITMGRSKANFGGL